MNLRNETEAIAAALRAIKEEPSAILYIGWDETDVPKEVCGLRVYSGCMLNCTHDTVSGSCPWIPLDVSWKSTEAFVEEYCWRMK